MFDSPFISFFFSRRSQLFHIFTRLHWSWNWCEINLAWFYCWWIYISTSCCCIRDFIVITIVFRIIFQIIYSNTIDMYKNVFSILFTNNYEYWICRSKSSRLHLTSTNTLRIIYIRHMFCCRVSRFVDILATAMTIYITITLTTIAV